jgi:hypothetical protein
MKYLNEYRLFESESVSNEEVTELIEECKDIVETFNESEDAYKVANYENGFVKFDKYLGRNVVGNFESRQSHESDMAAIKFNLGLSSDLQGQHFKEYEESVTPEKIDELIELLNKSKKLVQRLSRYCSTIYYKLNGKSVRFMLIFTNPDESGSKASKIKRIYQKLSNDFRDYDSWKTMTLVQYSSDGRFPERYKALYNLIKNNPNLIDGNYGQWDESRRSNLQLRFAGSETMTSTHNRYLDTIIVNVSGFKYKTYMMDRFKSIRLSNEEKAEAMKCIEQKVKNSLRSDADSIETSIEGNQIKIKVK